MATPASASIQTPSAGEFPPSKTTPDVIRVGAAAANEKPVPKPAETRPSSVARGQLEKIAGGMPVTEATTAKPEQTPLPDQETMHAILTEANQVLLDAGDPRLLVTAIATQAADTPLGNELKLETLDVLTSMSTEGLSPEPTVALTRLQERIASLTLPKRDPATSSLAQTIEQYNNEHPNDAVDPALIDAIRSGNQDAPQTIAGLLSADSPLARVLWKELTGAERFTGFEPTPERILQLAELDLTSQNRAKAEAIFTRAKEMKLTPSLMEQMVPPIMYAALSIMFISQLATGESSSGH